MKKLAISIVVTVDASSVDEDVVRQVLLSASEEMDLKEVCTFYDEDTDSNEHPYYIESHQQYINHKFIITYDEHREVLYYFKRTVTSKVLEALVLDVRGDNINAIKESINIDDLINDFNLEKCSDLYFNNKLQEYKNQIEEILK